MGGGGRESTCPQMGVFFKVDCLVSVVVGIAVAMDFFFVTALGLSGK